MLLEVLVVAIAALTMGAAATLAWLRWRENREADGWGVQTTEAPGVTWETAEPGGTKYPTKIRISDDVEPTCTGDSKLYCVDGVEYQGSCDVETREIPPGARVVEGGCARYEPGDGLIPLRFRR